MLLIEYRTSISIAHSKSNEYQETEPVEDEDVMNERKRVARSSEDVVIVRGMRKEYPDGKKNKVSITY